MSEPSPTPTSSESFLPGVATLDEFSSQLLRQMSRATQSSNRLPSDRKQDWDYYNTFSGFRQVMESERADVARIVNDLLKWSGVRAKAADNVADMIEMLSETNDVLLERINTNLDEAAGLNRDTSAFLVEVSADGGVSRLSGSWNRRNPAVRKQDDDDNDDRLKLVTAKTVARPQVRFKDKIDNSDKPFIPKLTEKPNSKKPLSILVEYDQEGQEYYSHPYLFELETFKPQTSQLAEAKIEPVQGLEEVEFEFIDTPERLEAALKSLKSESVIAVDLEGHWYRSFQGFVSLIQISSQHKDYVIDPFSLRSEIVALNEVFTDPHIVKVFHGADSDIVWLQRDFSVYVVNMFDTHLAAKMLNFPPGTRTLAFLLRHYCSVTTDKRFQLADWRIRPLPDDMLRYARTDTRFLINIYSKMKNELISKGNEFQNLLLNVIESSAELCKRRYEKPVFSGRGHEDLLRKSRLTFNTRQLFALAEMFSWRNRAARLEDESESYVLPNHMLLKICTELPKEMQGITACCNPMPPLVKQHLQLLHLIVLKAREKPLVRVDIETSLVHQTPAPTLSSEVTEDPLKTPFDLSHILELHGESLLEGAEVGAVRAGKARLKTAQKPTLTVFDQEPSVSEKLHGVTFLSPYQRYQMLKPYLQYMKEVDKTKADSAVSDQQRIDSIKMHFEALTAMTSEEYSEERDQAEESLKEEENADEAEGGEFDEPDETAADQKDEDIKPLRISKNYWKKRKRPQKSDPSKKPKLETSPEEASSTPARVPPPSIDYENADFGQYASRQSDRNSAKGQFNPDAQLRSQKQQKAKRNKFAKRGKSFTYNKKN